jgi:hypothetical protein
MGKILIKGGTLITIDPKYGQMTKGDILVKGTKIEAITKDLGNVDAEVINAEGMKELDLNLCLHAGGEIITQKKERLKSNLHLE